MPALEKSAPDLPDEYDPPARLGWVYMQGEEVPRGRAVDRPGARHGVRPAQGALLGLRADIAKALGDTAGEQRFRADAAALAKKE